jgi:hypothetical protein
MHQDTDLRQCSARTPERQAPLDASRDPGCGCCQEASCFFAVPGLARTKSSRASSRSGSNSRWFRGHSGSGNSSHRAAASAVSWGAVLKAMDAVGAFLCTTFRSLSKNNRLLGGMRIPPPITMQS